MKVTGTTRKMARRALEILLQLSQRENAHHLLTQAIAFLEMLDRDKDAKTTPVILSVRVMQLRKS
jgi:hypothetical protein